MNKFIFYFLCFFSPNVLFAQFYYSDIIGNKNANQLYQLHQSNKVKSIVIKNITNKDDDANKFSFTQVYKNNAQELKAVMNLPNGGERTYTTFYANNKIVKKEDDGLNLNSLIRYEYNNKNQLTGIFTSSVDTSVENQDGFFEKHLFMYDEAGQPSKMYKIKNNSDTTKVEFVKDEMGNIGEEKWFRKNVLIETYYYYFNDKKQLTDIVRFNEKYQKMLPEFLFDYNENNQLIQMKQIPYGSGNYTIVKYFYDAQGLKTYEEVYTKKGELLNKISYEYD